MMAAISPLLGRAVTAGGRVRRSWLLIPATQTNVIERCWTFDADVIVLDLEDLVHDSRKYEARANIANGIALARKGGAEVFVRCDLELLYADLDASVWRGLQGIILPKVVSVEQVQEAEETLAHFEAERGVKQAGLIGEVNEMDEPRTQQNSIEIHLAFENAKGNHAALELIRASGRIRSVSLGRADLVMDLRAEPSGELHLLPFLMQRLITVANTTGVVPVGAWWQGNSRGLRAGVEETRTSARLGRAAGFKGAICVSPEQVAALNDGFTPSPSDQEAASLCRRAFAEARDRGNAYGEVDGVLVDQATALGAEETLAWAAACMARDQFKAAAVVRAQEQEQ
jgi:citrate lyase subunit beta/citryl-CoA lyase